MQPAVAAQKAIVKTETQQTFVNGLLGFTLGIYTPLEAYCIAHNNCMSLPIDMRRLYATAH